MIDNLHELGPRRRSPDASEREPAQLDLFEYQPPIDAYCFAMRSMHGHTFVEAMYGLKPALVIDVRSHPSFNLIALNRDHAMDVIRRTAGKRVLASVQLRFGHRHEDRWRAMSEARRLLMEAAELLRTETETNPTRLSRCIVFFVADEDDVSLLTSGMRNADSGSATVWRPGRLERFENR